MSNKFTADNGSGKACCIVCEREIPDGNWFARFKLGNSRVMACGPSCMEKFLDHQNSYVGKIGMPQLDRNFTVH